MASHLSVHADAAQRTVAAGPGMDVLMVVGFVAAFMMLVCLKDQGRSRSFVLGMAICSAVLAVYAFGEGVWPLGFVQIAGSISIFRRWRRESRKKPAKRETIQNSWETESRVTRLFGPTPSDSHWIERQ